MRTREQKLESFRQLFLVLTNDDVYSHADQHKLYQFCQRSGLNWNEARAAVHAEALALLTRVVRSWSCSVPLSRDDLAELDRWRRRLALNWADIDSVLDSVLPGHTAPAQRPPKQRAQRLTTDMLRSQLAHLPTTRLRDEC